MVDIILQMDRIYLDLIIHIFGNFSMLIQIKQRLNLLLITTRLVSLLQIKIIFFMQILDWL